VFAHRVVSAFSKLDVQISDVEGVFLDELSPWRDLVAHQDREQIIRSHFVFDSNLQQPTPLGVHRRLPQLIGIHFTKTLVALNGQSLLGPSIERFERLLETADRLDRISFLQGEVGCAQALQSHLVAGHGAVFRW
jgi:hypothetical protein